MPTMKFYMTPGSCSTGIHIILEELDEIFEVTIVNLPNGDHFKPDYVAVNPNDIKFRITIVGGTPRRTQRPLNSNRQQRSNTMGAGMRASRND